MRFDPLVADFEERYEKLCRRKGITENVNLLRFCIFLMAPDSPLRDEKDFDVRIDESISLLKLPPDTAKSIRVEVDSFTDDYQETVYELFRLYHHRQFQVWFSLVQSMHIMSAKLRSPNGMRDTDRRQLSKEMVGISEQLDQLEYILFKDENLRQTLMDVADTKSLSGYAEVFALESPQ